MPAGCSILTGSTKASPRSPKQTLATKSTKRPFSRAHRPRAPVAAPTAQSRWPTNGENGPVPGSARCRCRNGQIGHSPIKERRRGGGKALEPNRASFSAYHAGLSARGTGRQPLQSDPTAGERAPAAPCTRQANVRHPACCGQKRRCPQHARSREANYLPRCRRKASSPEPSLSTMS